MIVSLHHYTLQPNATGEQFEACVSAARARDLFRLPGLLHYYFLKGVKGARAGGYTAVWVYESREAWEALWGPASRPYAKDRYPANWLVWEDELLRPILDTDPDRIDFTSYACFAQGGEGTV